jgi:hypothetical protein
MEHPVQYVAKLGKGLDRLIHDHGDYLFMGFVVICFVAIARLLGRKRKPLPPETGSARTRALIGVMLASPRLSSDADGGRTRLIMGERPPPAHDDPDRDRAL